MFTPTSHRHHDHHYGSHEFGSWGTSRDFVPGLFPATPDRIETPSDHHRTSRKNKGKDFSKTTGTCLYPTVHSTIYPSSRLAVFNHQEPRSPDLVDPETQGFCCCRISLNCWHRAGQYDRPYEPEPEPIHHHHFRHHHGSNDGYDNGCSEKIIQSLPQLSPSQDQVRPRGCQRPAIAALWEM